MSRSYLGGERRKSVLGRGPAFSKPTEGKRGGGSEGMGRGPFRQDLRGSGVDCGLYLQNDGEYVEQELSMM